MASANPAKKSNNSPATTPFWLRLLKGFAGMVLTPLTFLIVAEFNFALLFIMSPVLLISQYRSMYLANRKTRSPLGALAMTLTLSTLGMVLGWVGKAITLAFSTLMSLPGGFFIGYTRGLVEAVERGSSQVDYTLYNDKHSFLRPKGIRAKREALQACLAKFEAIPNRTAEQEAALSHTRNQLWNVIRLQDLNKSIFSSVLYILASKAFMLFAYTLPKQYGVENHIDAINVTRRTQEGSYIDLDEVSKRVEQVALKVLVQRLSLIPGHDYIPQAQFNAKRKTVEAMGVKHLEAFNDLMLKEDQPFARKHCFDYAFPKTPIKSPITISFSRTNPEGELVLNAETNQPKIEFITFDYDNFLCLFFPDQQQEQKSNLLWDEIESRAPVKSENERQQTVLWVRTLLRAAKEPHLVGGHSELLEANIEGNENLRFQLIRGFAPAVAPQLIALKAKIMNFPATGAGPQVKVEQGQDESKHSDYGNNGRRPSITQDMAAMNSAIRSVSSRSSATSSLSITPKQ